VLGQATGNSGLTTFTTARIQGKPHLPPYSILCVSPRHLHSNDFLSQDSQRGVPKLSRFEFLRLCKVITFCPNLKQTCNFPRELSNGVSHSTCMHRGQVNSRLLVVGNQIAGLTLGPSFCHNMCCRCPNGPCNPLFDVYTLIAFQMI